MSKDEPRPLARSCSCIHQATSSSAVKPGVITAFESASSAIRRDSSPACAKAAISVATMRERKSETSFSADTSRETQGSPRVRVSSSQAVCERPSAAPISSDVFTPIRFGARSATEGFRVLAHSALAEAPAAPGLRALDAGGPGLDPIPAAVGEDVEADPARVAAAEVVVERIVVALLHHHDPHVDAVAAHGLGQDEGALVLADLAHRLPAPPRRLGRGGVGAEGGGRAEEDEAETERGAEGHRGQPRPNSSSTPFMSSGQTVVASA